nr:DedA family protein [Ferroacidibacillus organovorans]
MSLALEHAVRHYGIAAVFFTMLLESACIPIPSELIMTFAGYAAFRGEMGLAPAIIAGVLGNLIGSLLAYWIGLRGGRAFLRSYGRYVLFSERHFESSERFFAKYGAITVLISRLLPAVRTFISLPAGIAKMRLSTFMIFTIIGCIPWVAILAYVGYALGQHWETVTTHFTLFTDLSAALLVVLFISFLLRNRRHSR